MPGAPDTVIGKALNDKFISLSWKEPQQPNGIILGYQIVYYNYYYKEEGDKGTEMVIKINLQLLCTIMQSNQINSR